MTKSAVSLLAYQAGPKQRTIDAIAGAGTTIEAEMAEHGFYPHNGGHLSKPEVLRRAGVSPQTLKNATRKETGEAQGRRLIRIEKTAPVLKPEAEDAKAGRIVALEKKLADLVKHCDRFKLDYNDLLLRCKERELDMPISGGRSLRAQAGTWFSLRLRTDGSSFFRSSHALLLVPGGEAGRVCRIPEALGDTEEQDERYWSCPGSHVCQRNP